KDRYGSTLMSRALNECLDDINKLGEIDKLVEMGVDLNKFYNNNISITTYRLPALPSAWAKVSENLTREKTIVQVADHLIQKGADINQILDDSGNTIFCYGISFFSSLRLLLDWYLKNEGNINFQNNAGNTALHLLLLSDQSAYGSHNVDILLAAPHINPALPN